jgi:hypothetical protein
VLIRRQPAWFFGLAVLAFVTAGLDPAFPRIEQVRSFFGVHRVVEDNTGRFRLLLHGTTLHGAERVRNADGTPVVGCPEPTTYYYFAGRSVTRSPRPAQRRGNWLEWRPLGSAPAASLASGKTARRGRISKSIRT